jgi:hypothetical protein
MGGQQSQPIQLVPGPGFQKRKANTFPGYEKYDFGGYEIWGPYKKTPIPGAFGTSSWEPRKRSVDGAVVLEKCLIAEGQLKRPQGSKGLQDSLIVSYSDFSTSAKPDVGTDKPACYQDNASLTGGDDGLFYIHYKHPMFARYYMPPLFEVTESGLIPTILRSKQLNKATTPNNIASALKYRRDSSPQGILETIFLIGKSKQALNRMGHKTVDAGIYGPLQKAVQAISRNDGIFNFGYNRTLKGGKKRRGTRRNK